MHVARVKIFPHLYISQVCRTHTYIYTKREREKKVRERSKGKRQRINPYDIDTYFMLQSLKNGTVMAENVGSYP